MGVQHIQVVCAQAAQAVLHVLNDALRREVPVDGGAVHDLVEHRRFVPPLQAAFGGEHHLVPVDVLQGLAHHGLAVVQAIDGRGVDPPDALLHSSLDGFDRKGIIVVAPPAAAADGPGAHAQKRYFNAAAANVQVFHIRFPPCQQCSPQWEPFIQRLASFVVFFAFYKKENCGASQLRTAALLFPIRYCRTRSIPACRCGSRPSGRPNQR